MVSRYGISVAIVRALVIGGLLWGALWWALHHSVATAVSGDTVSGDAAPAIAASTILAEDSADGGTLPMPQSGMATNLTSPAGIESSHLYSYTYGSWFALEAATTIYDMAVDAAGNLYFVGVTRATSMPGFSTEPWECAQPGNNEVGFIASFTAQGTPRYGDFLGTCYSEMTSIVVDDTGNAYVGGETLDANFPVTPNAYKEVGNDQGQCDDGTATTGAYLCGHDAFVAKYSPQGELLFATYLGGNDLEWATEVDLAPDGDILVAGYTTSDNLPTKNDVVEPDNPNPGQGAAYLAKLRNDGTALQYITYVGKNLATTENIQVAGHTDGSVYIASSTRGISVTHPTLATGSLFVTKLNSDATAIDYQVRLGGSGGDLVTGLAVDAAGYVYLTGQTQSDDFIVTDDALIADAPSSRNAYVAILSPSPELVYGTYLGGTRDDYARELALDPFGNLYVTGYTISSDFPAVDPLHAGTLANDHFLSVFAAGTRNLVFSTMVGGRVETDNSMIGFALAADGPDQIWLAGYSFGDSLPAGFPATSDAYQSAPPNPLVGHTYWLGLSRPITPTIFVHGIAGSKLVNQAEGERLYWLDLPQPGQSDIANLSRLSLYPSVRNPADTFAPSELFASLVYTYLNVNEIIYGPFLDQVADVWQLPVYQVEGNLARQTTAGCDMSQAAARPLFFPFVYDWRQDNSQSAAQLADYVGCVRKLHPQAQVNIVAHSMGGLVSRRYMLDHPQDHHIAQLVSVGTPWLGAAKLANVLATGDFPPLTRSQAANLVNSFPGAHQLLPSAAYYELGGTSVFGESNYDYNQDGETASLEFYDYPTLVETVDRLFAREAISPGVNGLTFHTRAGQDDWRNDTSGVTFHHIVGDQSLDRTVVSTVAGEKSSCNFLRICSTTLAYTVTHGPGDGTVPLLSAARRGNDLDYNAPEAQVHIFPRAGDPPTDDTLIEHTGLMRNPHVLDMLGELLFGFGTSRSEPVISGATTAAVDENAALHYINVVGAEHVTLHDAAGRWVGQDPELPDQRGYVPGVDFYALAEAQQIFVVPNTGMYTLTLAGPAGGMLIEVRTGNGSQTDAVQRYVDLELPTGAPAALVLSGGDVAPLLVDQDEDGTPETPVMPTVNLAGSAAQDNTPPALSVFTATVGAEIQITVEAEDAAGDVAAIYYALDDGAFERYTEAVLVNPANGTAFAAFADDAAANRSATIRLELGGTDSGSYRLFTPRLER